MTENNLGNPSFFNRFKRLITLLEMKTYMAFRLVDISRAITNLHLISVSGQAFDSAAKKECATYLQVIAQETDALGLKFTREYASRFKMMLDTIEQNELLPKTDILEERFLDEVESIAFFRIENDKIDFFKNAALFGNEFATKFPKANFEIAEAGKCFAAGRNTATAFHLMRALEFALRAVASGLGLPAPVGSEKNWSNMLRGIKTQIDSNNRQPPASWNSNEKDFYEKCYSYLEAARTPFRNPTMHIEADYDEDSAKDIFDTTRVFMRHVATRLAE